MSRGIRDFFEELMEAVFPSNIYCMVCGSMIDRSRPYSLCDDCIRKMHWINGGEQEGILQRVCEKCGKALPKEYRGRLCYDCMRNPHYFEKGYSCLTYGLHERELMMDLKYNGKSYIAAKMGEVMFDRMRCELFSAGGIKIDAVIPVPVSGERMRKRGYNQSEIMARYFLKQWAGDERQRQSGQQIPMLLKDALFRVKNTQMLRSLDPVERAMAMAEAFAVREARRDALQGKNLLLIDDIYTTGATADACSKVLLEAGADRVYLLTLASGGNRRPSEL